MLGFAAPAHGAVENQPVHSSGDKQLWHHKENRIELFGHASVSQPGETLTADYIVMDMNSRVLDAKGNCVYIASGSVIYGEEMHFNLDTRTGSVIGGRVTNQKFSLSGERINKLGEGRFQTHWGEYSTCRDCPNSWSILAEDVDMQIEGYAFMSNVTGKISDAPTFWLPYLIMPMKTRRQTGLLFPSFSFGSANGATFVLPFFWAINRSADMTLGLGYFSARGERVEWEGRYAFGGRSTANGNFYFLSDKQFVDINGTPLAPNRFAYDFSQIQELPFGIIEKLRLTDVSDNGYPREIGDVPGLGELTIPSSLSLSYGSPDLSAYIVGRRYRNLVNTNPDPVQAKQQFDPRTVQALPAASVTTNDRLILGSPIAFGLTAGLSNFTRSSEAFDYDATSVPFGTAIPAGQVGPKFRAGIDPIRKAVRYSVTPTLYTTLRPFDAMSIVPSLKYYTYLYSFPETQSFPVANLFRNYMLFQTDFSTQLERIYEFPEDKSNPRVKHLIRPTLTYSYIPPELVREDTEHPFLKQIATSSSHGISGYYFDDSDIVPLDSGPNGTNYFIPLGNSLQVGIATQWIKRNGAIDSSSPTYSKYIDATAGEAINFRGLREGTPQGLSRFYQTLELSLGRFGYSHTYYYYPYIQGYRHALNVSTSYSLASAVHQGIFSFERSLALNFVWDQHGLIDNTGTRVLLANLNYSLSDYILPSLSTGYDSVSHKFTGANLNVQFQSPSRCWKFTASIPYTLENGVKYNFDLSLNLTGSGFGGVSEVANTAVSH